MPDNDVRDEALRRRRHVDTFAEGPYHGCACGAVGGQPHGRFAPTAPEVVATAAELGALPVGSVVLDPHRMAWQRRSERTPRHGIAPRWYASGVLGGFNRCALPARVLYRPTVDGAR